MRINHHNFDRWAAENNIADDDDDAYDKYKDDILTNGDYYDDEDRW